MVDFQQTHFQVGREHIQTGLFSIVYSPAQYKLCLQTRNLKKNSEAIVIVFQES